MLRIIKKFAHGESTTNSAKDYEIRKQTVHNTKNRIPMKMTIFLAL
jgi:hypothetical protein